MQLPNKEDHNKANKCLLDGARRLGYNVKIVPQNISGSFGDHARCGASCTIGCRGYQQDERTGKMSGHRAFLRPAMESTSLRVNGLDGVEVERVLFEGDRAVGAIGWRTTRGKGEKVVVNADTVVVSAGTLHTPTILLRSGIKVSPVPWAPLINPRTLISAKISISIQRHSSFPLGLTR